MPLLVNNPRIRFTLTGSVLTSRDPFQNFGDPFPGRWIRFPISRRRRHGGSLTDPDLNRGSADPSPSAGGSGNTAFYLF